MRIDIRQSIEIIGLTAVVLSLLFVGYEVRLSRMAASTENLNAANANNLVLRGLITQNYDVWTKGCRGTLESEEEELLFGQLIIAYDNWQFVRWANIQNTISILPQTQAPLDVALNMHRFPGFRETWLSTSYGGASTHPLMNSDGSSRWHDEVERLYGSLQEDEPSPSSNINLCGR